MCNRPAIFDPCPAPGSRLRLRMLIIILAALLWLPVASVLADENEPLPELGDSAARTLSPAQEARIGQQFLRQLLRDKNYVDDPEFEHLSQPTRAHGGEKTLQRGTRRFAVHLLQNPKLNAFAVPGGHITFHTGLILTTEDENELGLGDGA